MGSETVGIMLGNSGKLFSPVIAVHGGAWAVPDDMEEETLQGVKHAAKVGYKALLDGSSCVDAVLSAVCRLEDDPLFDAGRGSVLNAMEDIEMHAIVMRGDTLDCGGVIGVKRIKNPVKAARLVMEKTEHCVVDGDAAHILAKEHGLEEMPKDYFITKVAQDEWDRFQKYKATVDTLFNRQGGHDTVGAVALDKFGNLACATSTGGITMQIPGRVSDCPIPGAGGYADNESLAISTTGHGESIMKTSLARRTTFHAEQGMTPQASLEKSLRYMKRRVGGCGGAVSVDRNGRIGVGFTTEKMSWAAVGGELEFADKKESIVAYYGILPGETRTENFDE